MEDNQIIKLFWNMSFDFCKIAEIRKVAAPV